jgi:hypothetical protein
MLRLAQNWTLDERYKAVDNMDLMSAPLFETGLCLEPNSPDSVCPADTSALVANEPLRLDQSLLSFDPDMFANEFFPSAPAVSTYLSAARSSITTDEDEERSQATSMGSPASSVAEARQARGSRKATLSRKRTKRIASFDSSDDGFEMETKPSNKKAKSSPSRAPRSRMPTSAYRGVSRCTKDGRWQARIRIDKEVVYLGRYPTEEQAARRYDEAARLHHGATAMLNFITPEDVAMGRKSVFSSEQSAA